LRLGECVEGVDGACGQDARFCPDEDGVNPAPTPRLVGVNRITLPFIASYCSANRVRGSGTVAPPEPCVSWSVCAMM
jgi:hypothetical protein